LYCNLGLGHGPFVESALTEPEETNITMITAATTIVFFPCFRAANGWGFRWGSGSEGDEPKMVGKRRWKRVSLGCGVEVVAVFAFEEDWVVEALTDFPS